MLNPPGGTATRAPRSGPSPALQSREASWQPRLTAPRGRTRGPTRPGRRQSLDAALSTQAFLERFELVVDRVGCGRASGLGSDHLEHASPDAGFVEDRTVAQGARPRRRAPASSNRWPTPRAWQQRFVRLGPLHRPGRPASEPAFRRLAERRARRSRRVCSSRSFQRASRSRPAIAQRVAARPVTSHAQFISSPALQPRTGDARVTSAPSRPRQPCLSRATASVAPSRPTTPPSE